MRNEDGKKIYSHRKIKLPLLLHTIFNIFNGSFNKEKKGKWKNSRKRTRNGCFFSILLLYRPNENASNYGHLKRKEKCENRRKKT